MPFIDANAALQNDYPPFDQIVVGAGAAGILLATRLAERGKRVLLLESGHFEPDEVRQALNRIEETGKRLGNAVWTRKRILGGTTTAWGGQALPFMPIDFRARPWAPHSGWPISYETLAPYYPVAGRYMGVDDRNYDSDIDRLLRRPKAPFDTDILHFHYSKWAEEPNQFLRHREALEQGVTVLYNAQLLRIDLDESDRATAIEVANFAGGRKLFPASELILATGGIEAVRILLLNRHQKKEGLGNQSGWLGRAFMEHPCMEAGVIETRDAHKLQSWLGTRIKGGRRYSQKVSASEAWQERNELLSITGGAMWLYEGGAVGPLTHLRLFLRRPTLKGLAAMLAGAGALAQGLWALTTEGLVYKPGATARLLISAEQAPSLDSRITLGEELDAFGQPLARLHWTIGDLTWKTIVRFLEDLRGELARTGLGTVRLFDCIRLDEPDWRRHLTDVNHHTGGARMSATPDDGVVDPNLQVWGAANLYVCSASVFPTSYHSNPTLTVLALGARLVDKLTSRSPTD